MKKHYPLMIDLTGRFCLVVGGGEVATRKVESLLEAGAIVTVISPDGLTILEEWSAQGSIQWEKRSFMIDEGVDQYKLVVAATNNPEVNLSVYTAVTRVGGWINIVDRPDLCNFIVPSTVHRGKLVISISTSGASPGLASRIRQKIDQEFGPEYEGYVNFLAEVREHVLQTVDDPKQRRAIFRQLLNEEYLTATDEERNLKVAALLDHTKQAGAGRQS
ncbi:precorrin-2 dehydrogenase/sirohydrochlorin ferrochelatase family protein [Brevibacillus ginsengisoli]|uniref:precorrin-2 dehydrogenase/sirohydrochlorin ferrochelatase family protein n=1 Tax=Brevibacillus ginsengisoli TaxID=363854 RepID=UPI003CF10114